MQFRQLSPRSEYFVRLERGEAVLPSIVAFCKEYAITCGSFRALGAVEKSSIGYYDLAQKKYGQKEYPDAMEVASMNGNITLVDGDPFVHCHAVLSGIAAGTENQPVGGHVFDATVAVTLEVHIVAFADSVVRELDDDIGLKLLQL